ncbi:uncharacterized protein FFNC_15310 [Fusarium fujikuroi]|nr:uncharacterized protein FFE2_15949 [Fusarium fujikuroi]SCO54047.1 uncharacterized protein FFNC_15310 [Fusarium fujikuroi]
MLNNHRDDNEAGGIPSRPSDNPTLTHAPQAFDEAVATRLGADEIRKISQSTLSNFILHWAQALQHDMPNMLTIVGIRLIDMKMSLVREWDRGRTRPGQDPIKTLKTSSSRTEQTPTRVGYFN